MRAEPALGAAPQRPELEHREDTPALAHALAAVEDRRPAREDDGERDEQGDRESEDEQRRREHDVEHAQTHIARAIRRLEGELSVPANERVLEPRRLRHGSIVKGRGGRFTYGRSVSDEQPKKARAEAGGVFKVPLPFEDAVAAALQTPAPPKKLRKKA